MKFNPLTCLAFSICSLPLIIVLGLETNAPIRNCGNGNSKSYITLTRLELHPCDHDVCNFRRGENVTLIADFIPKIDAEKLKVSLWTRDWHFGFETLLLKDYELCGEFGISCPLKSNSMQNVYYNERLTNAFPGGVKLFLKLALIGDNDQQLLCKIVPLDVR